MLQSLIDIYIWQAFDPPIDMSQDMDICEDSHVEHTPNDHLLSKDMNVSSCNCTSTSRRTCSSEADEACCEEKSDAICKTTKEMATNKVSLTLRITILDLYTHTHTCRYTDGNGCSCIFWILFVFFIMKFDLCR